jgi:large subunit ribosomal protein L4
MTKKSNQLARKSALSLKAKSGDIMILEDLTLEKPKTKDFNSILTNLKVDDKKVLMLTAANNTNLYKSGRNIPKVNIVEAANAATYDLVNNQVIIIQKSALEALCKPLTN